MKKIITTAALVLPLSFLPAAPSSSQDLKIHVINVTLGDATFVEFPDGTTWLIDQGMSGTSGDIVNDYVYGIISPSTSFGYVVATHFDRDHYGGIDEVLSAGSPALTYTTAAYEHVGAKVGGDDGYTATWDAETTSPLRSSPAAGQTWSFGGVTVQCVCVGNTTGGYNELLDGHKEYPDYDENSFSIGFRISWGGFDYLTCGDLTSDVEDALAPRISSHNFDVLHVNHHGSSTSTSLDWCETLQPENAVISVGTSNSYGHPTQATLNNLNGIGSSWGGVNWIYVTEQGSGGGGSASNMSYLNDDIVITYNYGTNQYNISGGSKNDTYSADEGSGAPTPTLTPTPTGPTPTPTATPTVNPGDIVVNQVGPFSVTGGGVGEYVELYNNASIPVNLDGWTLNVYAGDYTFTSSDIIPAKGFYLIADTSPCGGVTPDVYQSTLGITDNGANSYAQLLDDGASVIDTVGWAYSSLYEGTRLGNLGSGKAWRRTTDGVDTQNNLNDFSEVVCNPRNSSTGPSPTPTVTPTRTPTRTPTGTPTMTPTPYVLPVQLFFDDFESGLGQWTSSSGPPESNTYGTNEPSGSYSLNLDGKTSGGDDIRKSLDLSGYAEATLSYWWQRTGTVGSENNSPESGEDLWVEYWNGSTWAELAQYPGSGPDMTTYYLYSFTTLPEDALHAAFEVRFRNKGTTSSTYSYDDYFVDDVEIRAALASPTPTATQTPTRTATPTITSTPTITPTGIPWAFPRKINFEPTEVPTPDSFKKDSGADYGTHGDYGWL